MFQSSTRTLQVCRIYNHRELIFALPYTGNFKNEQACLISTDRNFVILNLSHVQHLGNGRDFDYKHTSCFILSCKDVVSVIVSFQSFRPDTQHINSM